MSDSHIWKPTVGRSYIVRGYYTGDFFARCERLALNGAALLTVLDTMQPRPRVEDKCPFPDCIRGDWHGGDHEFPRLRVGASIEVGRCHAWYVPAAEEIPPADLVAQSTIDPWIAPFSTLGSALSTKARIPSARRVRCVNSPPAAAGLSSSSSIA